MIVRQVTLAMSAGIPMLRHPLVRVSSGRNSHLAVLIDPQQRVSQGVAGSSACEKAVHKLCVPWAQDIGVRGSATSIAISLANVGVLRPITP